MFVCPEAIKLSNVIIGFIVILNVLQYLEITNTNDYCYSRELIFNHKQYWRILTSVFYYGEKVNFNYLMNLYFTHDYFSLIESTGKQRKFMIFMLFGIVFFNIVSELFSVKFTSNLVLPFLKFYFSKQYIDQKISIGPVVIPTCYLPLFTILIHLVENDFLGLIPTFIGFFISHLYYFVFDVIPSKYFRSNAQINV